MKKVLIIAGALFVAAINAEVKAIPVTKGTVIVQSDWKKSKNGYWVGSDGTWYRINAKDNKISTSKDGKKWDDSKDGMWMDKNGKRYKVVDRKVRWSDNGNTWEDADDWTWEGSDGKWYRLDKDWNVWEK